MEPQRKAFTVLEVMVSLVLTAVMVLLMVRWVGTTGELADSGASTADSQRSISILSAAFADDVENAQPCDSQRRTSMFAQAGPAKVTLFRDVDNNGSVERVTWRLTGPSNRQLVREVAPTADDGCSPGSGAFESRVLSDSVRPGTETVFVPRVSGAEVPLRAPIDCRLSPTRCNWQALGLRVVLEPTSNGQPATLDEVADLNYATIRLPLAQVGYVELDDPAAVLSTETFAAAQTSLNDFDLRASLELADWSNGDNQTIVSHGAELGDYGYRFGLQSDGAAVLKLSPDGDVFRDYTSGTPVPFGPGEAGWLRVTFSTNVNLGDNESSAIFYTSSDGVTWSPLGAPDTKAGRFRVHNPATTTTIAGTSSVASNSLSGKVFEVGMYGTSNRSSNSWFETASNGLADGWKAWSSVADATLLPGHSTSDGPDGSPFQRVGWTSSGSRKGMALTGNATGASVAATNCENAWVSAVTTCLWPGTDHVVSFKARALGGAVGSKMSAQPASGATNPVALENPVLSAEWQNYSFGFRTLDGMANGQLLIATESGVDPGSLDLAQVTTEQLFPSTGTYTANPLTPPGNGDADQNGLRTIFRFKATDVDANTRTALGGGGEVWKLPAVAELDYL